MTTITEEDYVLDVGSCLEAQAWTTSNQYRGYASKEDLVQEGHLWLLTHAERVQGYRDNPKPRLAYWWLSRDLWECMDRYARDERAQALGYDPADEAFYGKSVLEALLPAVLNGNPIQPQGEPQEGKSNRDPAEGGTFLAMYIDVEKAWNKARLTKRERDTLRLLYGEQWTQQEVATEQGVGQPSVSNMVKRAFEKMVNEIGGQYPPTEEERNKRP